MKFVMVGSGAVGSYFGAQLQLAGQEVVFVARGPQLRALRATGLILCHEDEEIHLPAVTATDDMTAIGAADFVLISVKSWQIEAVVRQLPALKGAHTRFLTLQNGVEAAPVVATYVGAEHTLAGLVRGFFELEKPGRVRHVGVQPTIIFGQLDGQIADPAKQLHRCLSNAGVAAELSNHIEAALWEKFLLVTALSGMGAVTRATIGEIRDYKPTRQMLRETMREIEAVARGRRVNLVADILARTMAFVDTFPPEATTSMQRDIMNGLPSELEAQTGAVVRLGREAAIVTPLNQFIYNSLILQERRARGMS